MQTINKIKNLKGKKVLVRVDFNVPIENGKVMDDFRIQKALPTIKFLRDKGAKVILISHLGRDNESLLPVSVALNKYIKTKFIFDIYGIDACEAIFNMQNKDVILLENLRSDEGEQNCSQTFAKNLSKLADVYVNEAFSVSHRKAASIVLLPRLLPAYAGLQLEREVKHLSETIKSTKHPFLLIMGGVKFETKLPIIKRFLAKADNIFIGGALLNQVLKEKGYEVGLSVIEDKNYNLPKLVKNSKIILPKDVLVFAENKTKNVSIDQVSKKEKIIDIGPESIKTLEVKIKKAKLILWNGPLGQTSHQEAKATEKIVRVISKTKTTSIIGGGDTVEIISKLKAEEKFTFVSTGGGATLEFLAKGTLPGIKALR